MKHAIPLNDENVSTEILIAPDVYFPSPFSLLPSLLSPHTLIFFFFFLSFFLLQNEEELKSVLKISRGNEVRAFDFPTKKDALEWVCSIYRIIWLPIYLFIINNTNNNNQARQFGAMQKKFLWIKNYSEKPLIEEVVDSEPDGDAPPQFVFSLLVPLSQSFYFVCESDCVVIIFSFCIFISTDWKRKRTGIPWKRTQKGIVIIIVTIIILILME